MKVWIDQDLCTGDGLCTEIVPDVFIMRNDGLAYVKEGTKVFDGPTDSSDNPAGSRGFAQVPNGQEEAVIEAADECPGACIFMTI